MNLNIILSKTTYLVMPFHNRFAAKLPKATVFACLVLLPGIGNADQVCHATILATTPATRIDNSNGTVTDSSTLLVWSHCPDGQTWNGVACTGTASTYTWQSALQRVQDLNDSGAYLGKTNWRLPNIKELMSIVEEQCTSPAINTTLFTNGTATDFWSSSTYAKNGSNAWVVKFTDGTSTSLNKSTSALSIRLVRNTQ